MSPRSDLLTAQLRTAMSKTERRSAVSAFMSQQPSAEDVRACTRAEQEMRTFIRTAVDAKMYEARAAGEGTATAGGDIVPPGFADSVIRFAKSYAEILNDLEDLDHDNGQPWKRPQVTVFTPVGGTTSESVQLSDQASLLTLPGQQVFGLTPTYAALAKGSFQLLDDSAVSVTDLLASAIGESIGRQLAADVSTAIYGAATAGQEVTLGTVTVANVASLLAKLDPAHLPGARFYVSAGDYALLAKDNATGLKALSGMVPVVPTNAVTSFSTGTVSGPILANMARFATLRHLGGPRCMVLRERYAELAEFAVLCWLRADVQPTGQVSAAVFSH